MGLYSSALVTLRGTLGGWSALYEVSLRLVGITAFRLTKHRPDASRIVSE